MRLSFGIGVLFVPLGLMLSTEYVVAARYGTCLSDVVAGVVAPFAVVPREGGSVVALDEIPARALFVPEELEPEAVADPPRGSKNRGKTDPRNQAKPKALASIHVSAQTVLRIANSGRRPSGKPVISEGQRPAGIQVFGASDLGIGVRDGDVITHVSGVPVSSANQIIALVIAARGARQSDMVAQVYRGQRNYTLTVEQPYLSGAGDPPQADAGVQALDGLPASPG